MKNAKRIEQLHKKQYRAVLGFLTSFILLCFAGSVLFAKYYAGSSNKGVATASSLYFTSNILKDVKNKDISDYPDIYNTQAWDGTGSCTLNVQIRNYQNQLLFNDENLNLLYDISFQLENTSDGGEYTVCYGGTTKKIRFDQAITFENVALHGGKAITDTFTISVTKPETESDNTTYNSVGIKVVASPKLPSYVKDSVVLGGILYASTVSIQYDLKYAFSKVTDSLENYSGFPYTITYTPGEDNSPHDVKVMWNSSLQIDTYNKYYLQALGDDAKHGTEDGEEYIIISMQPYSSIDIVFYRAENFNVTTVSELNECVKVKDKSLAD